MKTSRSGRKELDNQSYFGSAVEVKINARDRLRFAKQILLGLALMTLAVFIAYAAMPANPAMAQIFELTKIGVFPLVTLAIAFYFPNRSR